ncbi:NUDIX domain-containing protein [Phyllobacterium sp.]|uniref:NUDIX domain-containing protein n=2 Tax=Pseudomonadota TaxID=1224 RepID=UPI0031FD238A|nr:NUDIX domain-containing protein [Phyllobacterium sp.]
MTKLADRVRIRTVKILADDWFVLKKTTFDYLRRDGTWQTQNRETYDRGNGAVILLYDRARRTVILTRQFRYPAFVNGCSELLIEAPAGLLDNISPEVRIRREAEEETGYRVQHVRKVFEAFMSPGSVTEKLYFFVGEYASSDQVSDGGGEEAEGEDIDVLELPFDEALAMIGSGAIQDGKTIMLLQHAALHIFA